MKKTICFFVALVGAGVVSLPLMADTETVDGYMWTYRIKGGKAEIYRGNSYPAISPKPTRAVTIPSTLGGKPVTSIGNGAFYSCSGLTSVTIPNSVTNIGQSAFYHCSGLTSVAIPESVTSIGNYAFAGCSRLTAVYIKDLAKWCEIQFSGSSANPLCYAHNLYLNGSLIENWAIPDGVTRIGGYVFYNCSWLTSVTIPDSVVSIGTCAFSGCSGLTSVTIGDGVTSIGSYAFQNCSGLTSVTIPDSVVSIGTYAFSSCSGLTSVTIPNSVTSIGSCAFQNCSGLTSMAIPDGVALIGASAFSGCSGLTSVTLPDSVTSIGGSAFSGCSGLTSVTIGDGVTSIGSYAFQNCSGLTSVTIPDGVTSIGTNAFCNCSGLTSVTIGDGVTSIGNNAFSGCSAVIHYMNSDWDSDFVVSFINSDAVVVTDGWIRENDPTIMDVYYCVRSSNSTVKVRVLAFEDGERSFAKVLRPETFVNDMDGNPTAQNIGDSIAANVQHKLSWRVSSDWSTRLAKVKFEVLVLDGELLPLKLRIIPASDQYGMMKVSWNEILAEQCFDALLWLYADNDTGLTLSNGVLKNGSTQLASGTETSNPNAISYVFSKMGYSLLSGEPLNYANRETRLGLSPSGARQYAYKIVEE